MSSNHDAGYYSEIVAADSRRKEFNIKNHSLLYSKQKPDFIFAGDSITHFWELNAYFRNPDHFIINRGIAGDNTTYLRKRCFTDVLQLEPKYCILDIGINDTIDLEGDYWKLIPPAPYENVLEKAKENYCDIIHQTKQTHTQLIVTSLMPIYMPTSLHERERKDFIKDFNNWLTQKARQEGLIFVNYYTPTCYPGASIPLDGITYDGLHPNGKGYDIMATILRNTLKQHNIQI